MKDETLQEIVKNLSPQEQHELLWFVWGYVTNTEGQGPFLEGAERWLQKRDKVNLIECQVCYARFHETDQSVHERDHGICPSCGYDEVKAVGEVKCTAH